jgi:hypothetical protein
VPRLRGCGVAARAGVVSLPCSVHEKEGREGRLRPAGGQGCGQDSYGRPLTEMPLRRAGIFARALSESCHGKPACPVACASRGHPAPRLLLVVVAQKFEDSQNTTNGHVVRVEVRLSALLVLLISTLDFFNLVIKILKYSNQIPASTTTLYLNSIQTTTFYQYISKITSSSPTIYLLHFCPSYEK